MLLFKFCGLAILFAACSLGGFLKSATLIKRSRKLSEVLKAITELGERIRADGGEADKLIPLCFGKEIIVSSEYGFKVNEDFLVGDDISLLKEFLSGFGMNDRKSEYERTQLYKNLFDSQAREATQKSSQLCKLYNTLGVLCGLMVCIFFL